MEFSDGINLERMSRKDRLRILGVKAVCEGLSSIPADPVLPPPQIEQGQNITVK